MNVNRIQKIWTGAVFAIAALGFAGVVHAESANSKDGSAPVPTQLEADGESELHNEVNVQCYVTLAELDEKGKTPEIAGTITVVKDGKTVNVQLSSPDTMRPRIAKYLGKPITLVGEYIKKDTIFLVHDISEKDAIPEAPPAGPPEGL